MKENILILHGGAPTAVINASLYGVITAAKQHPETGHIYGARHGTGGLLRDDLIELERIGEERLQKLPFTPGSAIGTSRDVLMAQEYARMAEVLEQRKIGCVLMTGGNGTMDACGKLFESCQKRGNGIRVIGIPKTIDNDLAVTDHSPGYGSAARFAAQSAKELSAEVASLPIHVSVFETLGRNVGWIAAASSLARDGDGLDPDLIYFPERAFDEEVFLADVERLSKEKPGIVVVVCEGLKNPDGESIVAPVFKDARWAYPGDVAAHLAAVIMRKLGCKARSERPGILGRNAVALQSAADREEAQLAGEEAFRAVIGGESGKMVSFHRVSDAPYRIETRLTDLSEVMLTERPLPDAFINAEGNGVTQAFIDWCRPLIGGALTEMTLLHDNV
ncbi:MAG: diphosphate--fructose-6-phosphate 1-phosphotransferase [Lachnospiraceae bacterium]|nr:diphosphate--fructose-6-phosphate 1-phosphotransferase [Lachnospiraceae bacterium]